MEFVKKSLGNAEVRYAKAHEHQVCTSVATLREELARVESLGGEGLMLRQPDSRYVVGRSSSLLKVKTFHDAEAVVVGHQAGAGKHKGRVGALLVRLPNGIEFGVGTGLSDHERDNPPAVGALITFRYQELSDAGVPRFPSYVRLRTDLLSTEFAAEHVRLKSAVRTAHSPASASTSPAPSEIGSPRYFEYSEGSSNKFWEVSQSHCSVTTRWGRIGSAGQSKIKTYEDMGAASSQLAKLISEKMSDGYVEKPGSPTTDKG
jgi:DNA ligase-1